MLKPTFLNICFSIFLKYLIFYLLLMAINNEFKLLQFSNIRNGQDLFYYLWLVLFFPIVDIILFSIPVYFSLKIKTAIGFSLVIGLILFLEYSIYAYFTSQKTFNKDALIKTFISIILLLLFFYKHIALKFKINN
jgi:hypothetical protein